MSYHHLTILSPFGIHQFTIKHKFTSIFNQHLTIILPSLSSFHHHFRSSSATQLDPAAIPPRNRRRRLGPRVLWPGGSPSSQQAMDCSARQPRGKRSHVESILRCRSRKASTNSVATHAIDRNCALIGGYSRYIEFGTYIESQMCTFAQIYVLQSFV